MINIAFIANEPTPYRIHFLSRIADDLAPRGVRLHSVFTKARGATTMPWELAFPPQINAVFFNHGSIGHRQGYLRSRKLFHEIRNHLSSQEVKWIALNGYNDWTRLMLVRWAKQSGIPLLIRGDSNIFDDRHKGWMLRGMKQWFLRRLAANVAGFLPMGVAGKAFFRNYSNHHLPSFVLPEQSDEKLWKTPNPDREHAIMQRFGWRPDRFRALYSGRLVQVKRVDIAINAFAQIASQRPQWDLVIAGDGLLRSQLEQLVPATLRERIQWLGFQQADDLSAIYRCCHLLTHPAEFEPWGLIIQEAVAAGLPVVTTEVVGSALELVRHRVNGMLTLPGNMPSFAAALLEATEPDNSQRLASQCSVMLEHWHRSSDPVQGMRDALQHFGILPSSESTLSPL